METVSRKIEQDPPMREQHKVYGDGTQNKFAPPLAREPKFKTIPGGQQTPGGHEVRAFLPRV
jgi:hypothetical protein